MKPPPAGVKAKWNIPKAMNMLWRRFNEPEQYNQITYHTPGKQVAVLRQQKPTSVYRLISSLNWYQDGKEKVARDVKFIQ